MLSFFMKIDGAWLQWEGYMTTNDSYTTSYGTTHRQMGGSLLGSGLRRPAEGVPFLDHGEPLDQRGGETSGVTKKR